MEKDLTTDIFPTFKSSFIGGQAFINLCMVIEVKFKIGVGVLLFIRKTPTQLAERFSQFDR